MAKDDAIEVTIKLFKRIKETSDGQDFIKYLAEISKDNYEAFKKDRVEYNEFHKGYAYAIDSLIEIFEKCDIKLAKAKTSDRINAKAKAEASMHY